MLPTSPKKLLAKIHEHVARFGEMRVIVVGSPPKLQRINEDASFEFSETAVRPTDDAVAWVLFAASAESAPLTSCVQPGDALVMVVAKSDAQTECQRMLERSVWDISHQRLGKWSITSAERPAHARAQ